MRDFEGAALIATSGKLNVGDENRAPNCLPIRSTDKGFRVASVRARIDRWPSRDCADAGAARPIERRAQRVCITWRNVSDARRADFPGLGAREPMCGGFGIAKNCRERRFQSQQARHPVDVWNHWDVPSRAARNMSDRAPRSNAVGAAKLPTKRPRKPVDGYFGTGRYRCVLGGSPRT